MSGWSPKRKMQSRLESLVEAAASTLIAYAVSVVAQVYIMPLYGATLSLSQNVQIVGIFTVISFIRTYWVRRMFERFHHWRRKRRLQQPT